MIAKAELRKIAVARLSDARALLNLSRYDGAIYLSGYAVEIGLKMRICKTLKWSGFPETNSEFQGLQSLKTHDFDVLLRLSGAQDKIQTYYLAEWSTVKLWKPEKRYAIAGTADLRAATSMINAANTLLRAL